MFISTAYAQTAGAPDGAFGLGGMAQLLPIVAIFVIFYFLLIRPQQRKAKEHKALLAGVRRGDRVVTGGGILGIVTKVLDEQHVQVEIAEGVRVRVLKGTIADIPSRTATAPAAGARRADDKRAEEDEADDEPDAESEAEDSRETTKS
ncbi:MAG TPA: preprotein translocase subunit YajC [Candidatus Angelobacter sp.]|nr:preprotein translocase subunit YajC [Candidatus Angelobacter sp.]